MRSKSIFFFCLEAKERHVLGNLVEPLRRRDFEVIFVDDFYNVLSSDDASKLRRFVAEERPGLIASHADTLRIAELLRPRGSFISIGIEHGIAPYKAYTYGAHLLKSDFYLAPTELWCNRLRSLFPDAAHRVRLGGYGRISEIRDLRGLAAHSHDTPARFQRWRSQPHRKLVIFSWDVQEDALRQLPDRDDIVYLLHPADHRLGSKNLFGRAEMVVSTPADCAFLLAHATKIFGDFSSLTLEAMALDIPAVFFLDRSLYKSDCDLPAGFLDRTSSAYALIPETNIRIGQEYIASRDALHRALDTQADICPPFQLPSVVLPPKGDNRELMADEIQRIMREDASAHSGSPPPDASSRIEAAIVVARAYQDVLGRMPDIDGFCHHTEAFDKRPSPLVAKALALYSTMANSPEGLARYSKGDWYPPVLGVRAK